MFFRSLLFKIQREQYQPNQYNSWRLNMFECNNNTNMYLFGDAYTVVPHTVFLKQLQILF